MLPPDYRLRKTKEFKQVASLRQAVRENGLLVKAKPSAKEHARFGIVVGKKVAKHAVRRNRIRRVLRAAIEEDLAKIKPGFDIVLIVLPGFDEEDGKATRNAVRRLFKRASLLQQP